MDCRIIFNVKNVTEEYKKLEADYPDERAIKDVTGSGASHGCCDDCLDRLTIYQEAGLS